MLEYIIVNLWSLCKVSSLVYRSLHVGVVFMCCKSRTSFMELLISRLKQLQYCGLVSFINDRRSSQVAV